jgi:hypothetical protein
VVHHPGQLLNRPLRGDRGQRAVDLGQVDALRQRRGPPVLRDHGGDDRDLLGGDRAVGEGCCQRGQVLQRPAVADQLPGRGGAQATVAAQPRLHRCQAVVLAGLLEFRGPHRAGQLGVEPVARLEDLGDPVELLPRPEAGHVVRGEGVEGRPQLAHRHLPPFEPLYEGYRWRGSSAA